MEAAKNARVFEMQIWDGGDDSDEGEDATDQDIPIN